MAVRSLAVGADVDGAGVAVVAVAVAAAAATASSCGPVVAVVGHGGSPVAAAPPAACDALDERRLVGIDVPDLSSFAGVRAGTDDATLQTKRKTRG
jgi:hypothetical protein